MGEADMKLTTIIGTTIAAVGLAACGSTVTPTSRPETPSPTAAPTPSATPAPTPGATPTTTPVATPGVAVTVTCSNIPTFWPYPASPGPYPAGAILATVTWHNVKIGDWLNVGLPQTLITSNPFSFTPTFSGQSGISFTQGSWDWGVSGADQTTEVARGTLTIPGCAPSVRVTACDHVGSASGGAISWSEPGYSTLTVTGPAPSTYHFTLSASARQYGPLTAGTYRYTFNAYKASAGGTFAIPACTGIAIG
jgi:hypothetical protein